MPQDYKVSINNLIVVWQGSSWSVIAPDGTVLARFMDKRHAEDFAKGTRDYAAGNYQPYDLDINTGSILRTDQNIDNKQKNHISTTVNQLSVVNLREFVNLNSKQVMLVLGLCTVLITAILVTPTIIDVGNQLLTQVGVGIHNLGASVSNLAQQILQFLHNLGLMLIILGGISLVVTGLLTIVSGGALAATLGCSVELIKWGGILLLILGVLGLLGTALLPAILIFLGVFLVIWIAQKLLDH